MREIKFRAWFKVHKRMVYNLGFDENSFKSIEDNADIPCVHDKDRPYDNNNATFNFELMQFTGLYDKNGKEIYEGDVCSVDCGTYIEIDFIKYEGAGFKFHNENIPPESDIEIIGNIHQNPELLK